MSEEIKQTDNEIRASIVNKIITSMSDRELRNYRRFANFYFPRNGKLIKQFLTDELKKRKKMREGANND